MAVDESDRKPFSLRRWSQRKLAAARPADGGMREGGGARDAGAAAAQALPKAAPTAPVERRGGRDDAGEGAPAAGPPLAPASRAQPTANAAERPTPAPNAAAPGERSAAPLTPPLESLTIDSDFSPFMRRDVDETLRRAALKRLFRDPRFNVIDGLDIYIDDYTKPDPLAADVVKTLAQARYIFDPPATRVTDAGNVEDVPAGLPPAAAADGAGAGVSGGVPPEPSSGAAADAAGGDPPGDVPPARNEDGSGAASVDGTAGPVADPPFAERQRASPK